MANFLENDFTVQNSQPIIKELAGYYLCKECIDKGLYRYVRLGISCNACVKRRYIKLEKGRNKKIKKEAIEALYNDGEKRQ